MCSLILSFVPAATWPLVIAANRDERLDRPWDPPGRFWPGVIAGRDRLAGGTWLGVNQHGVIAAVLNRTASLGPAPGKSSRGDLPLIALRGRTAAAAADHIVALNAGSYRGFNMLIADATGGFLIRGLESGAPEAASVAPGITMITAGDPNDAANPRIARYKPRFEAAPRPDPSTNDWSDWTALLADQTPPAETSLNVAPHDGFGTVSSCLVALAPEATLFQFAAGPPDRTAFMPVSLEPWP
ncbi:NRDE family protein [Acidiphilium sp. PA]|uniref:NRDE family protein n=1 Tax=Acidiphilium sp. PA TaxID=2871705 RepID=UPI0022431343|nr:NRDE family protein [Acidiphilium sp. PA]MCW8307907.1 NRDE family protein [Acidiphilium sp. PA]